MQQSTALRTKAFILASAPAGLASSASGSGAFLTASLTLAVSCLTSSTLSLTHLTSVIHVESPEQAIKIIGLIEKVVGGFLVSQALLFGADFHQPHGRGQQMFGDAPDFTFIAGDDFLHQIFAFFPNFFNQIVE